MASFIATRSIYGGVSNTVQCPVPPNVVGVLTLDTAKYFHVIFIQPKDGENTVMACIKRARAEFGSYIKSMQVAQPGYPDIKEFSGHGCFSRNHLNPRSKTGYTILNFVRKPGDTAAVYRVYNANPDRAAVQYTDYNATTPTSFTLEGLTENVVLGDLATFEKALRSTTEADVNAFLDRFKKNQEEDKRAAAAATAANAPSTPGPQTATGPVVVPNPTLPPGGQVPPTS